MATGPNLISLWGILFVLQLGGAAAADPLDRDPAQPVEARVDDLLRRMTLEEKIGMLHANSKFGAGGVPRLGIPVTWTDDGPEGVRDDTQPDSFESAGRTDDFATAMPVGIALAATWDPGAVQACAGAIGEEARQRGKQVILGPGINIMRTPLNGRNYDYFGEDPWLAARLTVGYVRGMQAEQVVSCLKHFAANNQETDRHSISSEMDERTLREIYLPAFEAGVREGGAMAVMGAYNRFRGEFCCQNDYLLNHILKQEWGFQGAVISDWSGTHDTDKAVRNGLDLEMGTHRPYADYYLGSPYLAGIKSGKYPLAGLDDKVRRNLRMLFLAGSLGGRRPGALNTPRHWQTALTAGEESIVLLKNDDHLLPLDPARIGRIAVIGDNAVRTFAAGFNSAGVKAFHETTILEGILARVHGRADVNFSQGYRQPEQRHVEQRDAAGVRSAEAIAASAREEAVLADRAVRAARQADVVLFIGGLGHGAFGDDEGTDRRDLALPAHQPALISRLIAANPRTAVILVSGSPVAMDPWVAAAHTLVEAWYGGSTAGNALAAVLFGDVAPSGKLPCTFPRQLADSPAHASGSLRQFPGENGAVHYDEGLLVGYRWFDTKNLAPLFPFGYGLSYATFAYSGLRVTEGPNLTATISFDLTNTGDRAAAEVVQLYVHPVRPAVFRPEQELKSFRRVNLAPKETRRVSLPLTQRSFAYYSPEKAAWCADAGDYELRVGSSSRDIRLRATEHLAQPLATP